MTSHLRLCCQKAHMSLGVWNRSRNTEPDSGSARRAGSAAGWLSAPCPGDFDLLLDVFKLWYCLSAGLGLLLDLRICWGTRAVSPFHEQAECRAFKITFMVPDLCTLCGCKCLLPRRGAAVALNQYIMISPQLCYFDFPRGSAAPITCIYIYE